MDETHFDAIILGTGLTESITAAALSKAGFKIAHIDVNSYYGADEASLTLEELVQWADDRSSHSSAELRTASQHSRFTDISRSPSSISQSRQYAISLCPSIIPAVGPLISSLIASGVSRYGGFKLLDRVAVYDPSGVIKNVPGSKDDIFKNKEISLIDKRRLMRFLTFAAGDLKNRPELIGKEQMPFHQFLKSVFTLNDEMATAITYSLTYCVSPSDPTLPALIRIRHYLLAAGRYGPSSFLVGHYGGAGEIAQGFCRTAAVNGSVYILGRQILSIEESPLALNSPESISRIRYSVELNDFPDRLTCSMIISSAGCMPSQLSDSSKVIHPKSVGDTQQHHSIARGIAIIDKPILFPPPPSSIDDSSTTESSAQHFIDTGVIVFPPSSLDSGSTTTSVHVLVTGEGSMSTPRGKWIIYLAMPLLEASDSSAELLLQPYLDATIALHSQSSDAIPFEPLFRLFYKQHPILPISATLSPKLSTSIIVPPPSSLLPEFADSAATNAEEVFWEAVSILKAPLSAGDQSEVPNLSEAGTAPSKIENFWPAVYTTEEETEDW